MASKKKDERKIVRWVTAKGKHMPIYADGSFGGNAKDDEEVRAPYKKYPKGHKIMLQDPVEDKQVLDWSYGEGWEDGYHVESTDQLGGKVIDKGTYKDYTIGQTVSWKEGKKEYSGTIELISASPVKSEDGKVTDLKVRYSEGTTVIYPNQLISNSNKTASKNAKYDTDRRNKSERGWYTGEPDTASLAKANKAYSKKASGDGYSVTPTNLGFVGDYVTAPSGEKYTIIKTGHWKDEYSIYHGNTGYLSKQPTDQKFSSSKDALQWLKDNDTKRKSKADSRKKKK